jgi:hypothetical protein
MISNIPQQNSSRSDLYNTVMNVVRSHLEQRKNNISNIPQKSDVAVPQLLPNKPSNKIMFPKPKIIHSIKPIPTPKQVTKYKHLKKTWDPNHTTLAWKG